MKNLRKPLLLLLLLSAFVSTGMAQPRFRKPLKDYQAKNTRFGDWHVGLKVGCPWNLLTKSDIDPTYLGHFGYGFGLSAERNFKSLSVGAEVLWERRGTRMMGQSTYQSSLHDHDTMRFETAIKYDVLTARIPITWYPLPPNKRKVSPYLFVAPGIESSPFANPKRLNLEAASLKAFFEQPFTPASVTYTETVGSQTTDTTMAWNPPFLDVTLSAGAGVLFTIPAQLLPMAVKFDIGARMGLLNLASQKLKEQGVVIRNWGIEAGLTFYLGIDPPPQDASRSFLKRTLSINLP